MRRGAIRYTDDMLQSLQMIITHSMEGAQGRFDAFMQSMQSSCDIVSSNRNELAGSLVQPGMLPTTKARRTIINRQERDLHAAISIVHNAGLTVRHFFAPVKR